MELPSWVANAGSRLGFVRGLPGRRKDLPWQKKDPPSTGCAMSLGPCGLHHCHGWANPGYCQEIRKLLPIRIWRIGIRVVSFIECFAAAFVWVGHLWVVMVGVKSRTVRFYWPLAEQWVCRRREFEPIIAFWSITDQYTICCPVTY